MEKSLFYKIIIILMLSSYFLTKYKTFLAKSISSSWYLKIKQCGHIFCVLIKSIIYTNIQLSEILDIYPRDMKIYVHI